MFFYLVHNKLNQNFFLEEIQGIEMIVQVNSCGILLNS